jgi:adenosylcobinamide-GDP ribazoletransferase
VGLLMLGLERGGREIFPVYLTAAVLVAALVVVTRGLHLDGLMDTCDGLFGGFSRERRLEIMRDSQVGAFGIAGAAGVLLLKYGALVSLLTLPDPGRQVSLLLFPMLSRWAMVLALGTFPYVWSLGLGSPFHQGGARGAAVVAAATAVGSAIILGGFGGAGMLVGASVLAWMTGRYLAGMLGGLTGDTYGAINEVVEAVALMAAVALVPHGWIEPLLELLG